MRSLEDRYFDWICCIAMDGKAEDYQKLLRYLFEKDYRYTHPRDGNREAHGLDLRYRFGYLMEVSSTEIACELDDKPCSLLEMMVALSITIEENVMRDFDIGDRTHEWFIDMINSLGINMSDDIFSYPVADAAVERFFNRDYAPNGAGGLFTLRHPNDDMRRVEIWYQAMWWIDEKLNI